MILASNFMISANYPEGIPSERIYTDLRIQEAGNRVLRGKRELKTSNKPHSSFKIRGR